MVRSDIHQGTNFESRLHADVSGGRSVERLAAQLHTSRKPRSSANHDHDYHNNNDDRIWLHRDVGLQRIFGVNRHIRFEWLVRKYWHQWFVRIERKFRVQWIWFNRNNWLFRVQWIVRFERILRLKWLIGIKRVFRFGRLLRFGYGLRAADVALLSRILGPAITILARISRARSCSWEQAANGTQKNVTGQRSLACGRQGGRRWL